MILSAPREKQEQGTNLCTGTAVGVGVMVGADKMLEALSPLPSGPCTHPTRSKEGREGLGKNASGAFFPRAQVLTRLPWPFFLQRAE